jgi:hypothetical protein
MSDFAASAGPGCGRERTWALLLLGLLAVPAVEPAEIRARFSGNTACQLAVGGVTLRSDLPYQAGCSGHMSSRQAQVPAAAGEALCLVTHSHRDHFLRAPAERYRQKLLGPADVTRAPPGRALALDRTMTFGPLVITPLATPHAGLERYSHLYHHAKGECVPEILGRGLPRQGHRLVFREE